MSRLLWLLIVAGLIIAVVAICSMFSEEQPPATEPAAEVTGADQSSLRDVEVGPRDEFVTSEACRECHQEQHASWHATYHRSMTQPATAETVLAPIDDITIHSRNRTFHLWREGDEFWIEMPDPDIEDRLQRQAVDLIELADVPSVRRRIVMTTGSHTYQAYWIHGAHGSELRQVPFVYHVGLGKWLPREDAFLQPDSHRRMFAIWNSGCIQCHSVGGRPGFDLEENTLFSSVAELGIACESCHGPGQQHVAFQRQPKELRDASGLTAEDPIVNPARLTHARGSEVCGQCHSHFHEKSTDEWWEYGYSRVYRPGQELELSRYLTFPDRSYDDPEVDFQVHEVDGIDSIFWPGETVRVGGREYTGLLKSACYERGEMSCFSCHSMHDYESTTDLLKPEMESNEACLQCHETYRERIAEHTHHDPLSSGSSCYNCHMPHTTYALLKTIRSHRIVSPKTHEPQLSERPNACNLCHLDQTEAWTAQHLSEWFGQPEVSLDRQYNEIAAGVLWLVKGDAAQRTIAAAALARIDESQPDREWAVPILAELLDDPYAVVRLLAILAVKSIAGYEDFDADYVAPREVRLEAKRKLIEKWNARRHAPNSSLLIGADGQWDEQTFKQFLLERNDREIYISE